MRGKLALCVVEWNQATGLCTVYSPTGREVTLKLRGLKVALIARITRALRGEGVARVDATRVVPMLFTYAEMADIHQVAFKPVADYARGKFGDPVSADAFDDNPYWDIEAERRACCD